jgi:hypothetical protein
MEMAHEPWSQRRPASSWWGSRSDESVPINDLLEETGPIIDDPTVEQEPEKLNRRLSPIFFHFGHIDVVYENETRL